MVEKHKRKKLVHESKKEAIEEVTKNMLASNKPIVRIQQIQAAVEEERGLEVPKKLVSEVKRKDMGMGYRLAKTVPVQCNLERCLVLR